MSGRKGDPAADDARWYAPDLMTNLRKKLKAEKKAKAKKDKAKHAKALKLETRKADRERDESAPPHEKSSFIGGKQASSKPINRASGPGHRTQGK